MEKKIYSISMPTISCRHFIITLEKLNKLKGVEYLEGDLVNSKFTVAWENPSALDRIQDTMKEVSHSLF